MKLFKILSSAAFSLSLISTAYVPEVKAGDTVLFDFNIDGNNWKLKYDTSGSNSGKFFLRKNSSKTLCKMYILNESKENDFYSCVYSKIENEIIMKDIIEKIETFKITFGL